MILTCPACGTRYQVDEANFPPAGRQVRCAKCGHGWYQPGAVPATQAPEALEPAIEPAAESPLPPFEGLREGFAAPAAPPKEKMPWRDRLLLAAGWLALAAAVLLIGFAAVRYRQQISEIWPQSASVYRGLGLRVDAKGLTIDQLSYARAREDGQAVLALTGRIVNGGAHELPVPQSVLVILSDDAGREVYRWSFTPKAQSLKPGQSVAFATRLSSPPATARHLDVRFADGGP
jgi:predicted Zn finger-like uncharacterized protein